MFVLAKASFHVCFFVFLMHALFCFIVFSGQYQCSWLPGKTRLRNDLLCVECDTPGQQRKHIHTRQCRTVSRWTDSRQVVHYCKTAHHQCQCYYYHKNTHVEGSTYLLMCKRQFFLELGYAICADAKTISELYTICSHLVVSHSQSSDAHFNRTFTATSTKRSLSCIRHVHIL